MLTKDNFNNYNNQWQMKLIHMKPKFAKRFMNQYMELLALGEDCANLDQEGNNHQWQDVDWSASAETEEQLVMSKEQAAKRKIYGRIK